MSSFDKDIEIAQKMLLARGALSAMFIGYRENGTSVAFYPEFFSAEEKLEIINMIQVYFLTENIVEYTIMFEATFEEHVDRTFSDFVDGRDPTEKHEGLLIARVKDSKNVAIRVFRVIRGEETVDLFETKTYSPRVEIVGPYVELLDYHPTGECPEDIKNSIKEKLKLHMIEI